jgi:hypothetical protein
MRIKGKKKKKSSKDRFIPTEARHSPVTEAELAAAIGLLDPTRSETREIVEQIATVMEQRPRYRAIVPDPEIWRQAGISPMSTPGSSNLFSRSDHALRFSVDQVVGGKVSSPAT